MAGKRRKPETGGLEVLRSLWNDVLRGNKMYSDLTIKCGMATFNVHKSIVCVGSSWFAAACRARHWKEAATNVITIKSIYDVPGEEEDYSCDEPGVVGLMLQYIYRGQFYADDYNYRDACRWSFSDVDLYFRLYNMGQKYQVAGLSSYAAEELNTHDIDLPDFYDEPQVLKVLHFAAHACDEGILDSLAAWLTCAHSCSLIMSGRIPAAIQEVDGLMPRVMRKLHKEQHEMS